MNELLELMEIIKNERITTLFQPIVSLRNGKVLGYEALSRGPKDTSLYSPIKLLKAAEKNSMLWELESLFRKKAIERAKNINEKQLLFLNVDPHIIEDEKFTQGFTKDILLKYNLSPDSIIFEITERTAIEDYKSFKKVLDNYMNQGYKIAIDDVGSGYSGMKTIKETYPNYIKIDMDLVRDVDKDTFKQAIIKAFVDLSFTTNIKLIAEGIETKEELEMLISLGVYAGQGYLIQRPSELFTEPTSEIKNLIINFNNLRNNIMNYNNNYHYIGNIVYGEKAFKANASCGEIKHYFDAKGKNGACIVKDDYPVGLIMRNTLDSELAKLYGVAVYSRRPISLVMDKNPLIVDFFTPINQVSELAMGREDEKTYDNIIITKNSKYFGMVSVKKLLQYATSLERNYVRELNPLTQLPGNAIIKRVLNDIIEYGNKSCILYLDLDDFKIYNDIYGFENGDRMLKATGSIINNTVKQRFPLNSFVGHIGGDDFFSIIETTKEECEKLCKDIILQFEKEKLKFFNEKDRENECIISENKSGKVQCYNLTSISIAVFYGNPKSFKKVDELALYISSIKKKAKKIPKSCFIIEEQDNDMKELVKSY